jgi:aldehyde dehydrogenase (NAD+)
MTATDGQTARRADGGEERGRLTELFERQRAHAPVMARTGAAERRERLRRLRAAIVSRRGEICEVIREDLGRHPAETELTEIHCVLSEINHALGRVGRWMQPQRAGMSLMLLGTTSRIVYEPRGVVLVMAPWNYPVQLLLNPLVASIAAGNCTILKPSEKTPRTAALLGRLIAETFDEAEVALVEGGPDVAQGLLAQPFDHVFFTGGTEIGRSVMAAAARHLASVTLELGGKSPAVVDESADLRAAAVRIVIGKFMNAGQTCVAPDYVLVHSSCEAAFLSEAAAALARFYGATEEDRRASPDFPRIVDEAHFLRLKTLTERTVAAGARVVAGARFEAATRYVAPTILAGVPPDAPVMEEEIFGPVLPVLAYSDLEEVVRRIRAGGRPLAMFVFGRQRSTARTLIQQTSAGAVVWNNVGLHWFHHGLPAGGVGASGMGSYHGVHGFRALSHAKPVVRQLEPALIRLFFPPYRGRLHALAQRLLRLLERL